MRSFFRKSYYLDTDVLRPLSHIAGNWELTWDSDSEKYREEEESYSALLNALVIELSAVASPKCYHENEDRLAEYVRDKLNWPIFKRGKWWIGGDYISIIQQGGFGDRNEMQMILAASGRVKAAQDRGQLHYDDMEESHRKILSIVLAAILYHRTHLLAKNQQL
jgi:hypothetical protein